MMVLVLKTFDAKENIQPIIELGKLYILDSYFINYILQITMDYRNTGATVVRMFLA